MLFIKKGGRHIMAGLPKNNTPWIPSKWNCVYRKYMEHSAWYSGDPEYLAGVYSSLVNTPVPQSKFWAQDVNDEVRTMVHVPLAGDIAATSANLLFSEPPTITIAEAHEERADATAKYTQERIDTILQEGDFYSRLLEAAETAAALGGCFVKPNWDKTFLPMPVMEVVQADKAIPEFRWGFLTAVTFFTEFDNDEQYSLMGYTMRGTKKFSSVVWRHLERHEKGYIYHGLYKGTRDNLGIRVGLAARVETADLQDEVKTGIDQLIVKYIPNMKPNRLFRDIPIGQSDYQGSEGLLNSLDATFTSWIRELRLGQARIIVPEQWLERSADGSLKFDVDREIFTSLDIDPQSAEGAGFQKIQFKLRTEEHAATANALVDRIVTNAGYSPQTFGLNIEGRAESGTALNIRERKSFITKGKKEQFFKTPIESILEIMLMIDNAVFDSQTGIYKPTLEYKDSQAFDIDQVSKTVETLDRARAISIKMKVRMTHPDWTEEQITKESEEIMKEQGVTPSAMEDLPV